ncbi:periplasmic chaperone for outer membrane proteins Skp [Hyunsoonleella jejuensis]|uniref:Periplasmic chaperone for outer membrane proteins Skp n=1 Tax=Hyunsoonleella jejuensis TaxID=419940 RepID=A0A1H9B2L2_9FLAO|nr:OmpH family outer membrane protein [Hyunsoonleella jejuensis]SEP83184.1 periplasmic chaperone for outer membrane proteins Skp [Hyunsoonleella jejuensis]
MKNIIYVMLAMLVLASCQKPNKIGYVDNSIVINDYQAKKDLEERYKGREQAFNKRRDSMVNAYQLDLKEAQIKAKRMSQANLQKLSQEIQQKEQLLSQRIQQEQQSIQIAFQADIDTLIVEVKDFVKDYGKKNGYTYILGTSDAAASVLYGTEENDLTQTILDALNAEYKKE